MRWRTPLSVAVLAVLTLVAPVRAQVPAPERKILENPYQYTQWDAGSAQWKR